MTARILILAAAAGAVLLAACEGRVGRDGEAAAENATVLAGSAEEGTFSIDAPGFEMKVSIPESIQNRANVESDARIIPPGATFRGIHVQADEGAAESGVEMRFSDPRPPQELARWYRTERGGGEFSIASTQRQGEGFLLAGETRERDRFTVRLEPRRDGGTAGRLTIRDSGS